MIAMTFNLIAAVLALVVLKPMRLRHFAAGRAGELGAPPPVSTRDQPGQLMHVDV